MQKYCYFPVLKTRSAENNAYERLDESVKDGILPIIEMTGELGYTYSRNYKKDESLRGSRRPGDINKKISKILNLIGRRRFILDITDDVALMYDGLSDKNGGLSDHSNGYQSWLSFLQQNSDFKRQVIPTIQFNTHYRDDLESQIKSLDSHFDYVAVKLPAFSIDQKSFTAVSFNYSLQQIINWIFQHLSKDKLIIILDFGYTNNFIKDKRIIEHAIGSINELSSSKALISVSSSFPNFVKIAESNPFKSCENDIFDLVRKHLTSTKVFCGDFASLHPIKYEMGGGGWIPRIDYIIRDPGSSRLKEYAYCRGMRRNTSSEYFDLAKEVMESQDYSPIKEMSVWGDACIAEKANNGVEGRAPSYWITVRANIYMTMQYLYHRKQGSFLTL